MSVGRELGSFGGRRKAACEALLQRGGRRFDGAIDPDHELALGNWLDQPCNDAGAIHPFIGSRGFYRGDDDGALCGATRAQRLEQFQAVHPAHLKIDNEAGKGTDALVRQQRIRGSELADFKKMRFEKRAKRIAHGFIVIDYADFLQDAPH